MASKEPGVKQTLWHKLESLFSEQFIKEVVHQNSIEYVIIMQTSTKRVYI